MSFIAKRMDCIDASGIRKVFALAAKMKDPINLSIGQPDYDVDDVVKEVAIQEIRAGFNTYTQTWGIDALREEASVYYQRRFGTPLQNVMVTSGVSGALFLALAATVNPVMIASASALCFWSVLAARGAANRSTRIPFAPFIAFGTIVSAAVSCAELVP